MTEDQFNELLKTLKSIDFWLGAIASHTGMQNRMWAEDNGIPVIWWDPTTEPWPTEAKHGEEATIKKLYIGMPLNLRKNPEVK